MREVFQTNPVEACRRQRVFESMAGLISGNYAGWTLVANEDRETHRLINAEGVHSISFYYKGKLAGFRLLDATAEADSLMQDISGAFRAARERIAKVH